MVELDSAMAFMVSCKVAADVWRLKLDFERRIAKAMRKQVSCASAAGCERPG